MHESSQKILIAVSSKFEAEQILKRARNNNVVLLALSLEAEFYLKKQFPLWENPLYELLDKKSSPSVYKYIDPNFKVAYEFCSNDYKYIRDRLGYFLTEIDRSLDFAKEAVLRFKPSIIICGELSDYKGSSVINGSLKNNAFYLIAKSKKIPFKELQAKENPYSIKKTVGKIIELARVSIKQKIRGESDLLIVATARQVILMENLIKNISRAGISVKVLTYNLTLAHKNRLDRLIPNYLEKGRLVTSDMRQKAQRLKKSLIAEKLWRKLSHPKYKGDKTITSYLRKKVETIVREEFDEILVDIPLAKDVISSMKPRLLLTATDPDPKVLPFIEHAKDIGVKTVSVQHGIYFKVDPPSNVPESNFFITWSNLSKKQLLQNKYFKRVKLIVGRSPFQKRYKDSILKSHAKRKTVLILTAIDMMDVNLKMYWYKRLFEELERAKVDHKFVIRANPFQRQDDLKTLISDTNLDVELDKNYNLHDSIKPADIVIFENTDSGMEAMLRGKPTIYFNPHSGEDYFGVSEFKASMIILNNLDLERNLNKFLLDDRDWVSFAKRGRLFAQKYFGFDRGSNQIVKIVKRLIGDS